MEQLELPVAWPFRQLGGRALHQLVPPPQCFCYKAAEEEEKAAFLEMVTGNGYCLVFTASTETSKNGMLQPSPPAPRLPADSRRQGVTAGFSSLSSARPSCSYPHQQHLQWWFQLGTSTAWHLPLLTPCPLAARLGDDGQQQEQDVLGVRRWEEG